MNFFICMDVHLVHRFETCFLYSQSLALYISDVAMPKIADTLTDIDSFSSFVEILNFKYK